ncbi:prepilin-type N-terminal cleavage/methylation domain-containing protein, partial [Pseudoalteromonas sp. SIMBA_162]
MRRNQQGFSLVEVMVVIAIIGILATMVLPNVLGNQEKANQQKVIADIVALE